MTKRAFGWWLRAVALLIGVGMLAGACSGNDTTPIGHLASGCSINSDCSSPLVCAFSRCHNACKSTRDCPSDERCMASDRPFHVCQLPEETKCAYNSQCPSGQLCGVDGNCRDQCQSDRDCVTGQVCTQGTCAEPSELNDAGKLQNDAGTTSDANAGQPCIYNSECPDPLICRAGLCAYECLGARDCKIGSDCTGNRCIAPTSDAGVDAPSDAKTCTYNSECTDPMVCRNGTCAFECLATSDCVVGQTCAGHRCVAAGDSGTGSDAAACTYNSECASPLVCKNGHCVDECLADIDCPTGQKCTSHQCVVPGQPDAGTDASTDGGCVPSTCLALSKNCGLVANGCGGSVACGDCPTGQTCGGGGIANVCGTGSCSPKSCSSQGKDCGQLSDGCSWVLQCGSCNSPQSCGGGGTQNVCGCTPSANPCGTKNCGTVTDSCGNTVSCGTCASPQTCGGGGTQNVCGCTPVDCTTLGKNCGDIPDGCGSQKSCGNCTGTDVCGGGGTPNVCAPGTCATTDCTTQGKDCGIVSNGCDGVFNCGSCTSPDTCGGNGTPNVCGCKKIVCSDKNANCGTIPDGCGGNTASCGTCSGFNSCGGGGVPNRCGCTPTTCAAKSKNCGTISDGCGNLLDCGSCTSPELCGGGGIPNVCGASSGPPSCKGGALKCGSANDDCCTSLLVPAGSFNRSNNAGYPAAVSDFRLDKYEVSVGRFRAFVEAGKGTQADPPAAFSGATPQQPLSGWDPSWNGQLLADTTALKTAIGGGGCAFPSGRGLVTWTPTVGANDNMPISCVTWYEAMAFCAWDNGWLQTETQWNYAAAGGSEQRTWPWGGSSTDCSHAETDACPGLLQVGSKSTQGDGKWGHADLVGNINEWTMDTWATPYPQTTCTDCVYIANGTYKTVRGGSAWAMVVYGAWDTTIREAGNEGPRDGEIGFRCARLP